jgi:hypothetical protein
VSGRRATSAAGEIVVVNASVRVAVLICSKCGCLARGQSQCFPVGRSV